MAEKQYTTWESLPEFLTAAHISEFNGMSRRRVYELFQLKEEFGDLVIPITRPPKMPIFT